MPLIMIGLSELATLQAPLMSTIRAGTQWIGVVNGAAGRFQAPVVASQVAEQVGPGITLYETDPDPDQRLRDITRLIRDKSPSKKKPLGILPFGGDTTLNDSLLSILRYIFPDPKDLIERPPDRVVDQMLESGVQLGTICMGGENDNGANYGAPAGKVERIMAYTDNARVTCLNMGMAILLGDETPQIFCHSFGAGETIATVFERTQGKRGIWNNRRQKLIGLRNILAQRTIAAQWKGHQGAVEGRPILEVLVHAAVRTAGINGLPGTPQPGLGIKIFPADGLWTTAKIFIEVLSRGRSSLKGDPSRLGPEARLDSIEDPSLQLALEVGDETEFSFFRVDGEPLATATQANGEFLRRTQRVRIRALPPFPRFMVMEGSLMANLFAQLPR